MFTTEIQKKIYLKKTPKKPKKINIVSFKKSLKKSKFKSPLQHKKNSNKKKLRRVPKSKLAFDNISLDTNSTVNTIEDEKEKEIFLSSTELNRYLNEINFVLKDISDKGFYPATNLETKNLGKNIIENISSNDKIKLILDIDETLVYSHVIEEIQKNENQELNLEPINLGKDEYMLKIYSEFNEKIYVLKLRIRPGLSNFFKKLSPFCEFYVNTMASKPYVSQVLKILEKNYGLNISNENVIYTAANERKILEEKITNNENFLILDDNICAWDINYITSIIPIQKFNDFNFAQNPKNIDIIYQYYLFSNKIYCFNEAKRNFMNLYGDIPVPHCVENINSNEINEKNGQFFYIPEIIIKSFILKKILNIPIRHCLHFIQNTILKNCIIYYSGYEQDFIHEMIFLLGGTVVTNLNNKNITHFIKNKNIDEKYDEKFVDVKWIFDCFFTYKKCNEEDYKK